MGVRDPAQPRSGVRRHRGERDRPRRPDPAGVGGFHAAIQFALVHFIGTDPASATAFALAHHAICFFPITVLGLAYLGSVGLSLGRVRELQVEARPQPEPP